MVPHSMATSFPIPRGCCMVPVAASSTLVCPDRFATPRYRSPHPFSAPAPAPGFPLCLVSVPHSLFMPHLAASNPLAWAHWILIYPGTVLCPWPG